LIFSGSPGSDVARVPHLPTVREELGPLDRRHDDGAPPGSGHTGFVARTEVFAAGPCDRLGHSGLRCPVSEGPNWRPQFERNGAVATETALVSGSDPQRWAAAKVEGLVDRMVRGGSNPLGRIDGVPARPGFVLAGVRGPLASADAAARSAPPLHTAQRTATPTPTRSPHSSSLPPSRSRSATPATPCTPPLSPRPAPEVPQGRWTDELRAGRRIGAAPSRHLTSIV
jgi:hypothetical protein